MIKKNDLILATLSAEALYMFNAFSSVNIMVIMVKNYTTCTV